MKKLVTLCITALWMTACSPSAEETLKYHQTLIVHQKNAQEAFLRLEKTLEDTIWEHIEAESEKYDKTLHDEIYAIKNQPTFDDQEEYKTLIQNYLIELKYIGDHEIKHYIEFMHTPDEEMKEKDRKYFNKLKPLIREKYQVAETHFRHGQGLFAARYGVKIE